MDAAQNMGTHIQRKVQEGVDEMKNEIVALRHELIKLHRVVTPLTAITDLSIMVKRMMETGRKKDD